MPKTSDQLQNELLVIKCRTGDNRAFDELVARWQQRMWHYAYRLVGQEEEAWELVQESWIAVIQSIQRLEDPATFPHWLFRIMSNKYVDQVRRWQRQRRLEEGIAAQVARQASDGGEDNPLQSVLMALPTETRVLLCLYYVEEFSIGEITDILHIPVGTVKSRLYHARQKLQSLLEEHADG